jgi:transposase InsO family protein
LLATAPIQVWSWDITKLLGPRKWTYYYVYVILDIFSRYATTVYINPPADAHTQRASISVNRQEELVPAAAPAAAVH